MLFIIPHHVCNGCPIAFNGAGLQFSFLEKMQKKVCNLIHRGWPEVHLVWFTPFDTKGPLWFINGSGWESLRSLNSCCHFFREPLFLNGRGSRSQACRFRLVRFLWRGPLKGCVTRSFCRGSLKGIWTERLTRGLLKIKVTWNSRISLIFSLL